MDDEESEYQLHVHARTFHQKSIFLAVKHLERNQKIIPSKIPPMMS